MTDEELCTLTSWPGEGKMEQREFARSDAVKIGGVQKMAYKGITEAQKRAHKRYMQSMAPIQLRLTELHRDRIKARAAELGESVNSYILRLVDEDIARGKAEND